jgi:hypothetical protein
MAVTGMSIDGVVYTENTITSGDDLTNNFTLQIEPT